MKAVVKCQFVHILRGGLVLVLLVGLCSNLTASCMAGKGAVALPVIHSIQALDAEPLARRELADVEVTTGVLGSALSGDAQTLRLGEARLGTFLCDAMRWYATVRRELPACLPVDQLELSWRYPGLPARELKQTKVETFY